MVSVAVDAEEIGKLFLVGLMTACTVYPREAWLVRATSSEPAMAGFVGRFERQGDVVGLFATAFRLR
jgi:hypothetical protein